MAENSKNPALSVQPCIPDQTLDEEEDDGEISFEQTLGNSIPNCSSFVEEDDDEEVINIETSPYAFDFDPLSPFNLSFFVPSPSFSSHHFPQISNSCSSCSSRPESEFSDSIDYPNCFYGEEEPDQMDYINDLFESRGEETEEEDETDQIDFINDLFDSRGEEAENFADGPFVANGPGVGFSDYDDFHLNTGRQLAMGLGFASGGLRVVGIESDSDIEELDIVSAVDDENDDRVRNQENFWDCPRYDNEERNETEDGIDGLSSVIDRIEEISVSSEISSGEDTATGVLEWEILLAVNNLERDLEFETEGGEGFVYTAEFDTLIGQFVETVQAMKGSPPAAKSIVDNLPSVVLKKEDVMEGDQVVCAVCKDEISVGEEVTQLPCRHHYHGECIVPWLSIRNTCPVCRFELPTDDVDYEQRKNRISNELQVGYDFELSL